MARDNILHTREDSHETTHTHTHIDIASLAPSPINVKWWCWGRDADVPASATLLLPVLGNEVVVVVVLLPMAGRATNGKDSNEEIDRMQEEASSQWGEYYVNQREGKTRGRAR